MALKLAEVLDLAIGVDIASVNFLHLREVLITVIERLDIGDVAVKKPKQRDADDINECEVEDSGAPLSDNVDEKRETHTGDDEGRLDNADDNQSGEVTAKNDSKSANQNCEENETKGDMVTDNSQLHARNGNHEGDGNPEEGLNSRTKSVNEAERGDCAKTRSESVLSQLSNASVSHNSALSSRILALEKGLKHLRNVVENLVSRSGFGGNTRNSLIEQLEEVEKDMEKVERVPVDENNSLTQRFDGKRSALASASRIDRRRSGQIMRKAPGKVASQRPVTQPLPVKMEGKQMSPQPTRPKTEHALIGRRQLSSKLSVLEKFKQRRRESTNNEVTNPENAARSVSDVKDSRDKNAEGMDTSVDHHDGSDESEYNTVNDDEMEDMTENEVEAALNDSSDLDAPIYAVRVGLEQMQNWREKLLIAQKEFRSEMVTCKNSIQKVQDEMKAFRSARRTQDAEGFNAIHHVHSLVLELDAKQAKISKTLSELVDEYNRHERTFGEIFIEVEKLDEQKVDKVLLSNQVGVKANKDELHDKVSVSAFDETFSLLDRALSDALDKMANQMSMEEALRETLNELQSEMESKLDRNEMYHLKNEVEARIKEVRSMQGKALESKPETQVDPAGFKRKTEKVKCISCNRDLEIETSQVQVPPSVPKVQRLGGIQPDKTRPSREANVSKKAAEDEYRLFKLKSEMVQGAGLLDLASLPMSQRFCGGRHTIMRGNKRSLSSNHFNDYVVIRNESNSLISLPSREFLVSNDSGLKRFTRQKLPAINEVNHFPDIQQGDNNLKSISDNVGRLSDEKAQRTEKKSDLRTTIIGKIPVCKTDDE